MQSWVVPIQNSSSSVTVTNCLTSRITALSSTKLHYIFQCSLMDKTHALIQVHTEFRSETSLKN